MAGHVAYRDTSHICFSSDPFCSPTNLDRSINSMMYEQKPGMRQRIPLKDTKYEIKLEFLG